MKYITIIILGLFLASCQTNPAPEKEKFRTIMLRSTGEIETLPDMASFTVQLSCLDKSVAASKKCLVDKSNELISTLLSLGLKKEDILTTSVDMQKNYDWRNNSRIFLGYNSSTTVYITVRDIDRLDEIYTELFENRNLETGGLTYSHSALDSLKNAAYVDALKKANVTAEKLLPELNKKEKEILKVGNVEITASMPEELQQAMDHERMEANAVAQKSIAIGSGTVKVTAVLYVEYLVH
jgi:uncharacterized protein YggE